MSAPEWMRATLRGGGAVTVQAAVFLIQLYRHMVSPLRPPTCRFVPTCSQYAVDALTEYGVLRGGWLAVSRLAKCGPWHRGGWDPVPERHDLHDVSAARELPGPQGESESFV